MRRYLAPKTLIILAGLTMVILCALLVKWVKQPSLGIEITGYTRGTAEFIAGSFITADTLSNFKPEVRKAPLVLFYCVPEK